MSSEDLPISPAPIVEEEEAGMDEPGMPPARLATILDEMAIEDTENSSRRSELTPGRRVTFGDEETRAFSEEEPERGTDSYSHMTREALERALLAAEIRAKNLEQSLRRNSRSSRYSMDSYTGNDSSTSRPKLEKPATFDGSYTELYNILNWLYGVERYLKQCRANELDFPGYARTYMDKSVQAWMDANFPRDLPTWETLKTKLIKRYLPTDHKIRLELLFNKTIQRSTLQDYMEQWQVLDAALTFSNMIIEDFRKSYNLFWVYEKKMKEDTYWIKTLKH